MLFYGQKWLLNGCIGQGDIPFSSRDQRRVLEWMEQTGSIAHCNDLYLWDSFCHGGVSLYLTKFRAPGNPESAAGTTCMHRRPCWEGSMLATHDPKNPSWTSAKVFLVFRNVCCLLTDSSESPSTTAHRNEIP